MAVATAVVAVVVIGGVAVALVDILKNTFWITKRYFFNVGPRRNRVGCLAPAPSGTRTTDRTHARGGENTAGAQLLVILLDIDKDLTPPVMPVLLDARAVYSCARGL